MRPALLVTALVAAGSAVAAQPAAAAFLPSSPVGTADTTTGQPLLAASADGSASLVYTQNGQVFAATKKPGEVFGTPQSLGTGSGPRLATSPAGRAVLAWIDGTTAHYAIRGPGSAAFTVQPGPGTSGVTAVATAIGDDGSAYVSETLPSETDLYSIAPGASAASLVTSVATPVAATGTAVAVQNGTGTVWLAAAYKSASTSAIVARPWSTAGPGNPRVISTLTDTSSGTPPLGSSTAYFTLDLVAASGAHPSFFWTRRTSTVDLLPSYTLDVMRSDEPFTAPPTIADTESAALIAPKLTPVSIGSDAAGNATAVWSYSVGVGTRASAEFRPAGGSFGLTRLLDLPAIAAAQEQYTSVAVAPTGNGASQLVSTIGTHVLATPLSPAGATLDTPTVLDTQPTSAATIGVAAASGTGAGDTAAAWARRDATTNAVQVVVALDDVTPPSLTINPPPAPSLPAPTTRAQVDADNAALRQVNLSASVADTWTATSPVTWTFDDGATAEGATAVHTFATAGAHLATASVHDAAGNVTTKTLPLDIGQVSLLPITTAPPAVAGAKLGKVALSASRFAVVKGKTAKKGQGATLTYVLSAAAKIELRVSKATSGYRSGKTCVAKKPKGAKGTAKRCTFFKPVGLAGTPTGVAGTNHFTFDGKVAGKTLTPGKYQLAVGVVVPTQSHPTTSATLTFTIKK